MSNRTSLIPAVIAILAASPAFAQQPNAGAPAGQRPAGAAGMARAQFLTNVAAEFAQIDANKDGKATKAEIERHRVQAIAARQRANNRAAFASLDTNKDGSLSQQEFAAPLATAPRVNVDPLIAKLDANKDGGVTSAEFQAGAVADFTRLDTNRDNLLSPQEARGGNPRR